MRSMTQTRTEQENCLRTKAILLNCTFCIFISLTLIAYKQHCHIIVLYYSQFHSGTCSTSVS